MSIMFEPELNKCPLCGEKLVQKYNTKEKTIITLKEKLVCWERVLRCRNKECQGHSMSFHSAEYKGLALPAMSFGIDVLALEGGLRFEEHKTIDEVVDSLHKYGIHTNDATVSKHSDKYLALISGYHKEKIEEIRKGLAKQGGYILQIDGTVSVRTKTLYIFRDNISGTILYAALSGDDTDSVKPLVQYVSDNFGKPLGIISDMQESIIESVRDVFPNIPHQYCQYHFLKNVGNAILSEKHRQLGTLIRNKDVKKEIEKIQTEAEIKKKMIK
jgi:arginine repressor